MSSYYAPKKISKAELNQTISRLSKRIAKREIAYNVENKQLTENSIDLGPAGVIPGGGTAVCLNDASQAAGGINSRIGDRLKIKGTMVQIFARSSANNNTRNLRVILFRYIPMDKQTGFTLGLLFTNTPTPFTSPLKINSRERPDAGIIVYADKYYTLPARSVGVSPPAATVGTTYDKHVIVMKKSFNFFTNYEGNAGDITDIETNALICFVIPDQGAEVIGQLSYSTIVEDA